MSRTPVRPQRGNRRPWRRLLAAWLLLLCYLPGTCGLPAPRCAATEQKVLPPQHACCCTGEAVCQCGCNQPTEAETPAASCCGGTDATTAAEKPSAASLPGFCYFQACPCGCSGPAALFLGPPVGLQPPSSLGWQYPWVLAYPLPRLCLAQQFRSEPPPVPPPRHA